MWGLRGKMWDSKSSLGPHSPIRSLASKAGRPGWEKQRIWVIIHDTGLNMNRRPISAQRARTTSSLGGTLEPVPSLTPSSAPDSAAEVWPSPSPLAPHSALAAISQASCYSFLHSKWDGMSISTLSREASNTDPS